MEAPVIEKPDDSVATRTDAPYGQKLKLQQELRVISTRRSLTRHLLHL